LRTALRLGFAACLVAAGVLAALLARDVRSWRAALKSGDAVYAADPARASWRPPTRLGGLAEDLLGIRPELRLRRALQLYRSSTARPPNLQNAPARVQAQAALAAAARDSNRRRASQALTLLGILQFRSAARGGDLTQIDAAASDFTDAVRADPSNEAAKFDLELLLRAAAAHGVRIGPLSGGLGKTGRRGAGGGIPGRGY
jgi:hypothetical protein